MVKLKWPHKKHWRTRQLINSYPILKSNKATDTPYQLGILVYALIHIKRIEEFKELEPSYKSYRMEIAQAIDQIPFTPMNTRGLWTRDITYNLTR